MPSKTAAISKVGGSSSSSNKSKTNNITSSRSSSSISNSSSNSSSSNSSSSSGSTSKSGSSTKKNRHLPVETAVEEDNDNGGDDDDDGDDADDDPEVDDLVASTLLKFAASKFSSKAQACSSLRSSLMNAGKLKEKRLTHRGGVTSQKFGPTNNAIEDAQRKSALYDVNTLVAPSLKAPKVVKAETVGKGWFDLEPMKMDEKLKRDIKIIQMRNYLDPKRFYKNPDKVGKVLHIGTVIEGPSEYATGRLTNKQRKQTIVEEILGDSQLKDYAKRKYNEIQFEKQNKKKVFKKRKKLRH